MVPISMDSKLFRASRYLKVDVPAVKLRGLEKNDLTPDGGSSKVDSFSGRGGETLREARRITMLNAFEK